MTANAALLWQALGDTDSAVAALADAVAVAPTLAGDPYWTDDPERADLMSGAIDAASARGATLAFVVALGANDLARAGDLGTAFVDNEERAFAELLVDGWSGDETAIERMYARCQERPIDPTTIEWCVRLAVREGDERTADRYRNWAAIIEGPAGWATGIVRSHPQ